MKTQRIPKTELDVSEICLGTMTFGTPVGKDDADRLTRCAIDHGINFIDTANMYEGYTRSLGSAGGVSEEFLGEALTGRRDKVVLATKVGMKVGEAPEDEGTSPGAIGKHLDASLQRLQTDYVDIYYLHKPDPETPMADILGALGEAMQAGKIKHFGVSNYSADQLSDMLAVADANHLPRPVIHQPGYSLLKRDIEADLLPLCENEQIAVAPYQVLQGGLLTGKYRRGQAVPEHSRKAEKDGWVWELNDELFDKIEAIEADAQAKGRSLMQHTLLETLAKPAIISLVLGFKRIEQIDSALQALDA